MNFQDTRADIKSGKPPAKQLRPAAAAALVGEDLERRQQVDQLVESERARLDGRPVDARKQRDREPRPVHTASVRQSVRRSLGGEEARTDTTQSQQIVKQVRAELEELMKVLRR